MHVHAFSPMEVVNGTARTGLSIEDFLIKAREAGLGSLPGTAAEILDDEVRWVLTKGKLPTRTWIEVVSHRAPGRHPHDEHDDVRPRRQPAALGQPPPRPEPDPGREPARRNGFTEFVPLPFVHTSAPIYLAGVARPGPTLRDNLAVHAMARILLHGRIRNIQTSWVKLGVDGTRAMLQAGANDVGGTLMEETISRMAGSEHGSAKTVEELVEIGAGIGRPVRRADHGLRRALTDAPAPRSPFGHDQKPGRSPLDVTPATLYVVARNKLRTSAEGAEAQATGGGSREAKDQLDGCRRVGGCHGPLGVRRRFRQQRVRCGSDNEGTQRRGQDRRHPSRHRVFGALGGLGPPDLEAAFEAAGVESDIQNAEGDAEKMTQIADTMIGDGVTVLAIVNLDSESGAAIEEKAASQGVNTIDYDRLTLGGSAEAYISFDNTKVGELQGQGLADCLGDKEANIVYLNGSPTDNNATLFAPVRTRSSTR